MTATLALVVALAGGSAYAVDRITSRDIVNNSVRSTDLKNRIGVRGKDVKPNTLTGRQIQESTLSPASIVQVAGNETGTSCLLQGTPKACVAATVDLSRRSNLLVIATGNQETITPPAQALCRVAIDGTEEPLSVAPGEANSDNTDQLATNGFARTVLSRLPVGAGEHIVALRCERLSGQVRIDEPTIAAIAVAAR